MIKNTPFDTLQNEIASEKFAALRRISEHLSQALIDLEALEYCIHKASAENAPPEKINKMIDAFNGLRDDAKEWHQYLVVTREASGFFSSALQKDAYKIPPRKDLMAPRPKSKGTA